ncbi:MAG: hypothetical protein QGG54_14135 [Gammaproteobacteria bacterium]|jgi:hypothetical protein|nr:hypothetical protein [Gammaproteobacteria bacterium]MDP6537507.1 hypothetical protein [Gammaproteobacteria bacterium]MDP6733262.1 hypothetical protein [Gammaproteobacteria bacterium]HAJ75670.1 hypothetical protein [Gammaproteobacteria bacterium]|tara:strand:+ start:1520 stop:1753 length:234 start_codon:yes stop_codon:yes gene_type:complete
MSGTARVLVIVVGLGDLVDQITKKIAHDEKRRASANYFAHDRTQFLPFFDGHSAASVFKLIWGQAYQISDPHSNRLD